MKKINTIIDFVNLLNSLVYISFEKDYLLFLKKKETLYFKDMRKIKYTIKAIVEHFKNILKLENLETILTIFKIEEKKIKQQKQQNIDFLFYEEKKAMLYHMYCFLHVIYCVLITKLERIETKKLDFDNLEDFFFSAYSDEKWEYKRRYKKKFSPRVFTEKALTKRWRKKK